MFKQKVFELQAFSYIKQHIMLQTALFISVTASDSPNIRTHHRDCAERSIILMTKFVEGTNEDFRSSLRPGWQYRSYYHNRGAQFIIRSYVGIVNDIHGEDLRVGNFAIGYVPHSVHKLSLIRSNQKFELNTRLFPRHARVIRLWRNSIYGQLDLSALPRNLEELTVSENKLKGPVHLTSLPRRLRQLRFRENSIRQEYLFYHELPKNLKVIMGGNSIDYVLPLKAGDPEVKGVFFRDNLGDYWD